MSLRIMNRKVETLTIKGHSVHMEEEVQQPREHRDLRGRGEED
jgi:hypothetical protein